MCLYMIEHLQLSVMWCPQLLCDMLSFQRHFSVLVKSTNDSWCGLYLKHHTSQFKHNYTLQRGFLRKATEVLSMLLLKKGASLG